MRRISLVIAAAMLCSMALPAQEVVLPDGKAKDVVQHTCTECHGLEEIATNPMSRESWRSTVTRMVKKGAQLDASGIDAVVDYLSVYFAPDKVNVNTATKEELRNALGFSEAESTAIIEHRAKGKIDSLETLAKV